jgi:septal ring factor EnvC (AmiA/AmiB activator)
MPTPARCWRALAAVLCAGLLGMAADGAWAEPDAASAAQESSESVRTQREAEAKLAKLRTEIKALAAEQKSTEAQKSGVAAELRERDNKIAQASKDMREIDAKLLAQQQELSGLEDKRNALSNKLSAQREALGALLRSAYSLGQHEDLKLLLQQDDIATVARVLAYHRYFQQARLSRIQGLLDDLAELAKVQQAIELQRGVLNATRGEHERNLAALTQERSEREAMLAKLDLSLKDQQSRLAALGKDEKSLTDLLGRLRDIFADIPKQLAGAEPFEGGRGKYAWPIVGKLLVGFGADDDSGRSISGLVISAKSGADVRAISHGRVAYADWLKGYGLLLILDHGDGFMSLYGYNETLLKDVGDWVNAGELVATAGASGGRKSPALYFELRQRGKAIDPRGWLKAEK